MFQGRMRMRYMSRIIIPNSQLEPQDTRCAIVPFFIPLKKGGETLGIEAFLVGSCLSPARNDAISNHAQDVKNETAECVGSHSRLLGPLLPPTYVSFLLLFVLGHKRKKGEKYHSELLWAIPIRSTHQVIVEYVPGTIYVVEGVWILPKEDRRLFGSAICSLDVRSDETHHRSKEPSVDSKNNMVVICLQRGP
jgi:hypothetical protein